MSSERQEAGRIVLERVHPAVHTASRPAAAPDAPEPARSHAPEGRAMTLSDFLPVLAVGAMALASGDVGVSLLAGGAVLGAVVVHRLATVGRFGFGDGFLAFRSDAGWPRGVQEDDDFHWTWSPGDEQRPAPARRPAVR